MSVLFIIWQIGGDTFDTGDISSIFLGFVAILLTLFFVNLDRARKIKTEYLTAHELGFVFRNMAISLREIKEEMSKAEEKHDEITKINNKLNKSLHHIRYLHYQDHLRSLIDILDISDKITRSIFSELDLVHISYYDERDPSDVRDSVYRASETMQKILNLDWHTKYDVGGWRNIANLIITRDIYDYNPDNEPISGAKQSMYGNDANRATPI